MALRWFLNSAICHVLGYPNKDPNNLQYCDDQNINEEHGSCGVIDQSSKTHLSSKTTSSGFQMPLHYPRYSKADYQKMEEWKVDMLLGEYGLSFQGNLDEKREYAMGAFLWPHQY